MARQLEEEERVLRSQEVAERRWEEREAAERLRLEECVLREMEQREAAAEAERVAHAEQRAARDATAALEAQGLELAVVLEMSLDECVDTLLECGGDADAALERLSAPAIQGEDARLQHSVTSYGITYYLRSVEQCQWCSFLTYTSKKSSKIRLHLQCSGAASHLVRPRAAPHRARPPAAAPTRCGARISLKNESSSAPYCSVH